jgi:hypothetical protein
MVCVIYKVPHSTLRPLKKQKGRGEYVVSVVSPLRENLSPVPRTATCRRLPTCLRTRWPPYIATRAQVHQLPSNAAVRLHLSARTIERFDE